MKTKKVFRREIFSETRRFAYVSGAKYERVGLCEICAANESIMLAPEEIAGVLKIGMRNIYRRIEAGNIHFIETDEKRVLVCLKSLTDEINRENPALGEKKK